MIPPTAREQFQRVERLLKDLEERGKTLDSEINGDSRPYVDAALSFFVACWAVRDWLIEDERCEGRTGEIDQLIDAVPDLATCADIANRAKHPALKKHIRSKPHSAAGHTLRRTVDEGPPGPNRTFVQTTEWLINTGRERGIAHGASIEEHMEVTPKSLIAARELARRCVEAWRGILQVLGVPTTY
jgi:hypothetical protein